MKRAVALDDTEDNRCSVISLISRWRLTKMSSGSKITLATLPPHLLKKVASRLLRNSKIDPKTGCRNWTGSVDQGGKGYGRFSLGYRPSRIDGAHRVSWELENGPIPPGYLVRHRCHNRRCINPDHLQIGTSQDNVNDMTDARRGHSRLTNREATEVWGYRIMGWTHKRIAHQTGTSPNNIAAILAGRRRQAAVEIELEKDHANS